MTAPLHIEGACMCGHVRLLVTAPPMMTMACHCRGCQKLSASAFSLTVMIPAAGFQVFGHSPQVGALHRDTKYFFCPHCLNWLYTRPASTDAFINVRPTMFDMPEWSEPFIESCTSEKLPWARTSARHSFAQFPPMEQYGALLAEYAALRGGG